MPAYKVPVDVKKIKALMEELGYYKVYAFAKHLKLGGGSFSLILQTGTAGPKALYNLKQVYEETHGPMPEDYFLAKK